MVSLHSTVSLHLPTAGNLSLALTLEFCLFLFPQLLVNLRALAGLVAMCARRCRGVDLAEPFLLRDVLVLAFALSLTLELVRDGALVLC